MRKFERFIVLVVFVLIVNVVKSQVFVFSDYPELKSQFDQASIVMLGEIDHNDQASMLEKVELVKYLHDSLGFDILAFESSIYDMARVNELTDRSLEEALYSGIFPIWHHTQSMDSLINALKSRNFTLAGFDNQICSGGEDICLEMTGDLEQFLVKNKIKYDKRTIESLAREIHSFNVGSYTISEEFDPLLLSKITSLAASIKSTASTKSKFWYQNLVSIHGLFFDHYYNKISEKNNSTFKPSDSNLRDSLMASNVLYLLGEFPGSKIICWGVTYHFANNIQQLALPNNDLSKAKPMGYFLKPGLGDEIKIIGFTDLGKTASNDELLENVNLFKNEKALYNFSRGSKGKSSFIKYAPYPEGDWSEVLDLGIVINSKASIKLPGKIVSQAGPGDELSPVPYALIQIDGTTQGSVANKRGVFELIIPPGFSDRKIVFSSLGYETMFLSPSEIKSEIILFEKADLLNEVVITPKQNDPVQIVRELSNNRIKSAPKNPLVMTMYNYQEEINSRSKELRIRESALEYYYENRLKENELKISNILNYRSSTKNAPINSWPFAPHNADFQQGFTFTIDQTFKKLQIDSIYVYEKDKSLNVIEYTHLKPSLKTSGFGSASGWTGRIVYNPENMTMQSHYKELHFKKNENYGLFHISFRVEYFDYQEYVFPRLLITNYQFKNEDGSVRDGMERIMITNIELENAKKPTDRIWEFENAPSRKEFWKHFNTIPISDK